MAFFLDQMVAILETSTAWIFSDINNEGEVCINVGFTLESRFFLFCISSDVSRVNRTYQIYSWRTDLELQEMPE